MIKNVIVLTALLPTLLAPSALAQLRDCPADAGGPKIFADELHKSSSALADPSAEELAGEFNFVIQGKIDSIAALGMTDLGVVVVPCPGRFPTKADFDDDYLRGMNSDDIVLEVWGRLKIEEDDDGVRHRRARIFYLVIPLARYADQTTPTSLKGYYGADYVAADFVNVLKDAWEISGYAALSVGLKRVREEEFDLAVNPLCAAYDSLRKADNGTRVASDPVYAKVVEYAKEQATLAASRARTSGIPNSMKLIDADNAIPEACR